MNARSFIGTDDVGERMLEEEHVPAALDLVEVRNACASASPAAPPSSRTSTTAPGRTPPRRRRTGAPVVPDDHRVAVTAERLVQREASIDRSPFW